MATYSIDELKDALSKDCKLVGHIEDHDKSVKSKILSNKDVTFIVYYDPHTVIINATTFFRIAYIKSKFMVTVVDEVTKYNPVTKYMDIYIDNSVATNILEAMEDLISEYILIAKVVSVIGKVNLEVNIHRFRNVAEFKTKTVLPTDNFKIVFTPHEAIENVCIKLKNAICIGVDLSKYDTNIKVITELTKRFNIDNININALSMVYEAYCAGEINTSKMAIWTRAHNDFYYNGSPKFLRYSPEILAKCNSTTYLATYISKMYEIRISTKRSMDINQDFGDLSDLVVEYNNYYTELTADYIKNMSKTYRDGAMKINVIIDYNELLQYNKIEATENNVLISLRGSKLVIYTRSKVVGQAMVNSSIMNQIKRDLCIDGFLIDVVLVG